MGIWRRARDFEVGRRRRDFVEEQGIFFFFFLGGGGGGGGWESSGRGGWKEGERAWRKGLDGEEGRTVEGKRGSPTYHDQYSLHMLRQP